VLSLSGFLYAKAPAWADYGICSATMTTVSFGTLGVSALQGATTTATSTVNCSSGENNWTPWYFCNSIGVGSNSGSQTDRRLVVSGQSQPYISYQLYIDSAYANPYQYAGGDVYAGAYSHSSGASVPQTIYAKILSSPASIPPGTYTDSYTSATQAVITSLGNGTVGTPSNTCTGSTGVNWWATMSFTVTVTLQASCVVSATNISFGSAGLLTSNIDATGTISVTCTSTTPYQIALGYGNGIGAGGGARARYMPGPSGSQISYNLYSDSGRQTIWGNSLGVDTLQKTGIGSDQDWPVYARVPPQTAPAAGNYSDTVVVTVTY
jgi:spore coat protein U-like protein